MAPKRMAVTNIGTCRIAEPLGAASRNKRVRRRTENIYGFVHTTKEILQQLSYRAGGSLPEELAPYISAKGVFGPRQELAECEIFFVEISSVKEIHFGDHLLQINYLDKAFEAKPALLKTFFAFKRINEIAARRQALEQLPEFETATGMEKRILLESHVQLTRFEDMQADMQEIVRRLPSPVVFVNHITVTDDAGAPIASREQLRDWMTRIADTHGFTVFDPTPHVLAFGRENALEDGGRDTNHYTAAFKDELGTILTDRFCKPGVMRVFAKAARWMTGLATGQPDVSADSRPVPCPPATEPGPAALILRLGAALKADRIDEAAGMVDELIRSGARTPKALVAIAKVMTKTRRYDEAATWWQHAAATMPDQLSPLVELARCYHKARDYERAVDAADQVLAMQPSETAILLMKHDAQLKLGRFADFASTGMDLVACDPAAAFAAIGVLLRHGRSRQAAEIMMALRAAGCADASDQDLQSRLVTLLERSAKTKADGGDLRDATADWRAILVMEPDHPHAASRVGKLTSAAVNAAKQCLAAGDAAGAIAAYRAALDYQPAEWRAVRDLAKCYEQQEMFSEGALEWEKLGILHYQPGASFKRAARLAVRAGEPVRALTIYARLDPADVGDDTQVTIESLKRKVARSMQQQFDSGQSDDAGAGAQAIMAVDPDHPDASRVLRAIHGACLRQSVAAPDMASRIMARRRVRQLDPAIRILEQRSAAQATLSSRPAPLLEHYAA